jgi:hypothetical protein
MLSWALGAVVLLWAVLSYTPFSYYVTPAVFSAKLKAWVWLKWYDFMTRKYPQQYWTMMNYGYSAGKDLEIKSEWEWERYAVQMYNLVCSGAGVFGDQVSGKSWIAGKKVALWQ